MADSKSNAGRKSKYYTHVQPRFDEIREWLEAGMLDKDICKNLGISQDAFYRYKKEHQEFQELIDSAKQVVDSKVEAKLFELCMGYDYIEETVTQKGDVVQVKKHKPADFRAIRFWLMNRQPEHWKEKQDVNLSGGIGFEINLMGVDDDENLD